MYTVMWRAMTGTLYLFITKSQALELFLLKANCCWSCYLIGKKCYCHENVEQKNSLTFLVPTSKIPTLHSKRLALYEKYLLKLKPQNTVQALYMHRTNTVRAPNKHRTVRCVFRHIYATPFFWKCCFITHQFLEFIFRFRCSFSKIACHNLGIRWFSCTLPVRTLGFRISRAVC